LGSASTSFIAAIKIFKKIISPTGLFMDPSQNWGSVKMPNQSGDGNLADFFGVFDLYFRAGCFALLRDRLSIGLLFAASFSNAIVRRSVETPAGTRIHEKNRVYRLLSLSHHSIVVYIVSCDLLSGFLLFWSRMDAFTVRHPPRQMQKSKIIFVR
jgi:hypothetical protein